MKNTPTPFLLLLCLFPLCVFAQSDQNYSMFMYNKLLYNPGYAGSREVTAVNAQLRWQWPAISTGVRSTNIAVDAPVGTYMKPDRKVALGMSISREKSPFEQNTDFRSYYAYRIKLQHSVLSLGLSAGLTMYSTVGDFNVLVFQPNDPSFTHQVDNAILPNAGTGAYWSGEHFYCGLSVPNLFQNKYDPNTVTTGAKPARQIRAYYLSGGYLFPVNDNITLKPQILVSYAKNSVYALPISADINFSATAYDRIMAGVSYRTGGAIVALVQVQANTRLNIGYAYDYVISDLGPYTKGAHELVIGYEFNHEHLKFAAPRFSKAF